jgi:hypothetical protein
VAAEEGEDRVGPGAGGDAEAVGGHGGGGDTRQPGRRRCPGPGFSRGVPMSSSAGRRGTGAGDNLLRRQLRRRRDG